MLVGHSFGSFVVRAYAARRPDRIAQGRHVVAARSAHWVQFDEPELIVEIVRELVESARSAEAAAAAKRH